MKAFLVFILGFFIIGCSTPCNFLKKKSSIDQHSVVKCETFTCINEVDSTFQDSLLQQGKRMLQIYLIRHAKPNVKKNWFYSAAEAKQYVIDYNSVPIIPFDSSLVSVNLGPNHTIYCSSLPRSQETALKMFSDKYPIVSDSIFREFEIRMITANSFFKMPLAIWQAFSRGSWILGFNHRGIESHKEAKLRALQASENLIKVAHKEETAILVAHGMLNGAIESELKKKGWNLLQKQGHVNLGATILVKIVDSNK
ncbi:hypothetical protein BZG02_17680 [Labilibaculum filiforme]|uniref:Histidine phosphatase family protein n=1 Tax=Labilibaculum filiforme TaxID=1940526 RepID=A0A2N3HS04_9BACT|nr:histidine phosphatase family protein [Labilibaculum filiforme]PKQ60834.1 hypothetical protein BZG02_17680 [Labilibaculum filiforme]